MHIYTHIHHIVPRHAGGTDSPDNLVELTIEDHAIAHEVRYRIYGDDRDRVAALMIRGQISGYDAFMEMVSRPKSKAWKKKMSERNRGKNNPFYGRKQTQKQKDAARIANSVPKPHLSKLYKDRYANGTHKVPVMNGSDNHKSRAICGNGQYWESIHMCAKELGVNHNAIRYRLNSDKEKWKGWYYK